MLQKALSTVCAVEILAPNVLIDTAEQIVLENSEECELRLWVRPAARLEALLFLVMM